MATADATVYPVKGQAFRFKDVIKLATSGNPLTGGLTTLACTISKDGGNFSATGVTVAEIQTSGWVTVDLDATAMNANVVAYQITCANSDAVYATGEIKTCDFTESGTRAPVQTVLKVEQFLRQVWTQLFNRHTIDRSTGDYSVYDDADTAVSFSGTASDDGTNASRGKLS